MSALYHQHIMDHFNNPRLQGRLDHADFIKESANPLCGDSVIISGQIKEGILADVRFESVGCILVQSAASILCERVRGASCDQIIALTENDLLESMHIALGPNRKQCVILPLKAIQEGIKAFY